MNQLWRSLLALVLCSTLVLGAVPGQSISAPTIRVTVNGETLRLDVPPVVVAGRTLVPLRAIFEALGAGVEWDESLRRITGTATNRVVVLFIGSTIAHINGNATAIDVAPAVINGRTMVPVRFIAESLGAEVRWNDAQRTVEISTPNPIVRVTGLGVTPTGITLLIGAQAQATATVEPAEAINPAVVWASANPSIAAVDQQGLIRGVAPGNTLVTVRSVDGEKTATVVVVVDTLHRLTLTSMGATLGAGEHAPGAGIAVSTTVPAGQEFVGWTQSNRVVSTTPSFTFTMPSAATTLVASFRVLPRLTLQSLISTTAGGGLHTTGSTVAVSTVVPRGMRFVSWTQDTQVVSTEPEFRFTMPFTNTTLRANFAIIPGSAESDLRRVFRSTYFEDAFIEIALEGRSTLVLRGDTLCGSDRVLFAVRETNTGTWHQTRSSILPDGTFHVILHAPIPPGTHTVGVWKALPGETNFHGTHWNIALVSNTDGLFFAPPKVYLHNTHASTQNQAVRDSDLVFPAHVQAEEKALRDLAAEITKGLSDDYDKVFTISNWVEDNIYYDFDALRANTTRFMRAHEVLTLRRGVCQNYADLTAALVRALGIPCRVVSGFALGAPVSGRGWGEVDYSNTNHAWNEAFVNGRWIMIDTTWNSRNRFENGVFLSRPSVDTFFDMTLLGFSQTHKLQVYN